jgi:chromosome segregation ATPase
MEWLTQIATAKLPWGATVALFIIALLCSKGVDGITKLWRVRLDEKKQDDGVAAEAYALFKEAMTSRVSALEKALDSVGSKLEQSRAAHAKCEVETEKVKGDLRVMQEKLNRLIAHDENHKQHIEKLAEDVQKVL